MTKEQFITQIAKYVQQYSTQYGIKCNSAVIAQAILESACGTSELAIKANNYFGLKYNPKQPNRCPTACGYYIKVGSEQNKDGSYISSTMLWQKFSNMNDAVKGYFDFINNSNYSNLKGITDSRKYLETIRADKYCSSLSYVENCMNVIKAYNLTIYDGKGDEKMIYKVACDAGHGSATGGKRTPDGYREHWINVKCANYFDIAMKRCGIETLKVAWNDTNATDDADTPLATRQAQIKKAKCDISVSFHANAFGNGASFNSANGIETLISNDPNKVKDSKSLATKVQNHLIQGTKQTNRGVKTQSLAMCNCTAMGTKASILIEIGFMTNEYEANLMKTDAFCLECAEETAQGVCEYLGVAYVKNNISTTSPTSPTTPTISNISEYIKVGQVHANNFVGSAIPVTGKFDNATKTQAAKVLQQAMNLDYKANLVVDGIFGAKSKAEVSKHLLKKGNKSYSVSALIILLLLNGYNASFASLPSLYDANLVEIVKKYQKDKGLTVDGIVGINTWSKLLNNGK